MKAKTILLLMGTMSVLASCDANLILPYAVKNCTNKRVNIRVKDYLGEMSLQPEKDTVIALAPKEEIIINRTHGIGFPWETKKLYRARRGVSFNIIEKDTIKVDEDDKNWVYKRGEALYRIKVM